MDRSCRLLQGQPRQPFEWNYFPSLTERIWLYFQIKKEIWENIQGEAAKVSKERPLQSMAIVIGSCWSLKCYWQHLISTGWLYVPHNWSYGQCFAPCFWRSHYQPQSWCRLATSGLRFDTVGLLFVGCRER